jgi:hypothetical protein
VDFADLTPQARVGNVVVGKTVAVGAVTPHSDDAATIIFRNTAGALVEQILHRSDAGKLTLVAEAMRRDADADARTSN